MTSNFFSTASDAYKQYRPLYPDALYQYLAGLAPTNQLAWDCGCGNGQASLALSPLFKQVKASDISAEQVAEAPVAGNIEYSVSPGEAIGANDSSVDLVTVAQAIHWFDHHKFFLEVDRVLKPQGVVATWGYQLMYSDTLLDVVIEKLHSEIVGPYWPKGREFLDCGYSKIPFLYPRLSTPEFKMQCRWQLGHLYGYLNTWSACKAYQTKNGLDPIDLVRTEIESAWGDPSQSREIYWPLILTVGRKSG